MDLYYLHCVPVVNTKLHKTIQLQLDNPYLALTNAEQYYFCPSEIDIIKSLYSKGHFSPHQKAYIQDKIAMIVH